MMAPDEQSYDPSFREQSVDSTLSDHEFRISRLEKAILVFIGYALAEGANVVTDVTGLF